MVHGLTPFKLRARLSTARGARPKGDINPLILVVSSVKINTPGTPLDYKSIYS